MAAGPWYVADNGGMLNLANTAPGQDMRWDWRDMVRALDLGGGGSGNAFYNYGIDKQRTRKLLEYTWADRLHYAVVGTPNLLEYDQGFYVKGGDGLADVKPIAGVFKSQVYAMALELGLPEEITSQRPTTDTFSLAQTQDEFYFSLPYDRMDLCLYGLSNAIPAAEVGHAADLTADQVERVWRDITAKRRATGYLHARPLLVEEVLGA